MIYKLLLVKLIGFKFLSDNSDPETYLKKNPGEPGRPYREYLKNKGD
jgi:hypothetical protein